MLFACLRILLLPEQASVTSYYPVKPLQPLKIRPKVESGAERIGTLYEARCDVPPSRAARPFIVAAGAGRVCQLQGGQQREQRLSVAPSLHARPACSASAALPLRSLESWQQPELAGWALRRCGVAAAPSLRCDSAGLYASPAARLPFPAC